MRSARAEVVAEGGDASQLGEAIGAEQARPAAPPGSVEELRAQITALRKDNRELASANAILSDAAAFSARRSAAKGGSSVRGCAPSSRGRGDLQGPAGRPVSSPLGDVPAGVCPPTDRRHREAAPVGGVQRELSGLWATEDESRPAPRTRHRGPQRGSDDVLASFGDTERSGHGNAATTHPARSPPACHTTLRLR
jgi:hypothetical protein